MIPTEPAEDASLPLTDIADSPQSSTNETDVPVMGEQETRVSVLLSIKERGFLRCQVLSFSLRLGEGFVLDLVRC